MEPLDYRAIPPVNPQANPPAIPTEVSTDIAMAGVVPPSLSPQNLQELATARAAMKKIHRAARMALFEGFSIAIFGGLSVLLQLNSISNVIFGAVLIVIGIIEILTARGVRRLDARSARNLALNQLVFALLILIYAGWNLYEITVKGNGALPSLAAQQDLTPEEKDLLSGIDPSTLAIENEMMMVLYGGLIAGGVVEVGMAAYYHSRAKVIRKYIQFTPPWVIEMQKAGIPI